MNANPSGDVIIKIRDVDYTMRPSFKFITRVEDILDKSITEVVMELAQGRVRFGHVAIIIHQGIVAAGGTPPKVDEIGEWVREIGVLAIIDPVSTMLREATNAGPKSH